MEKKQIIDIKTSPDINLEQFEIYKHALSDAEVMYCKEDMLVTLKLYDKTKKFYRHLRFKMFFWRIEHFFKKLIRRFKNDIFRLQ